MTSYTQRGPLFPRTPRVVPAQAVTAISDLPDGQLSLLVAVAAARRTAARMPTISELRALKIAPDSSGFAALVTKGLLTVDWRGGQRIRSSMRPTRAAWEQLP